MVTRKIVGQVTVEEKNEIQTLFERRNGLNELAKIVTADNTELYEVSERHGRDWHQVSELVGQNVAKVSVGIC